MPRVCVNSADNFCYICGEFTVSSQKHGLTTRTRKAYHQYFGCKVEIRKSLGLLTYAATPV